MMTQFVRVPVAVPDPLRLLRLETSCGSRLPGRPLGGTFTALRIVAFRRWGRPPWWRRTPSGGPARAYPGPRRPCHPALRQGDRAGRRVPVLLHDSGDDVCQLLMPRLDPRTFVQQQALAVRATLQDEKHDDIHML